MNICAVHDQATVTLPLVPLILEEVPPASRDYGTTDFNVHVGSAGCRSSIRVGFVVAMIVVVVMIDIVTNHRSPGIPLGLQFTTILVVLGGRNDRTDCEWGRILWETKRHPNGIGSRTARPPVR